MKFTKITTDISYNINRKRYITIYYRRIPHFKDIKGLVTEEYSNHILFKNVQNYFFKISDYLTKYGYKHDIIANCILKSFDFTLNHIHPLLICPLIDILSLNKTNIPIYHLQFIINKLNQCYCYINPLKHITNLLLCNISTCNSNINNEDKLVGSGNYDIYNGCFIESFKGLLFKALLPQNNIKDHLEMYNILWIITNNVPFWISGLECDEWIVDVIKFFDIYKQELSIQIVECESVNEIRKILDTLNVTHQPIISHHCSIPIHIQNTNLTIHYPRGSDLYYKTNEFVPRYQLYLDILRKFGWDPVSISPIEWNRIRNNQIDVCKSYIKKILLNYYKKFIIK